MTTSDPPLLRLTSPSDLLAAVPYLLGFHPIDSIVVIGLCGTRSVFHVRGDLPATADADEYGRYLADVLGERRVDRVLMIGYGPAQAVTPVILAASHWFRAGGVGIDDALRVTDGRYWSYVCAAPGCCPPEGTRFDVSGSRVAAEATLAGCVALPDRAALQRRVAPPESAALVAMQRATARAEERLTRALGEAEGAPSAALAATGDRVVAAAVARYARGDRLDDDELAELSLLMVATSVRDAAWQRITRDCGSRESGPHLRLWTDVVARTCPDLAAPPASLLAFTAWRCGDGALAAMAVERALAADPSYSLARLMRQVLERMMPPSAIDFSPDRGSARTRDRLSG
jgi:hypothetical protein